MGNNCTGQTNHPLQISSYTVRIRKTLARGGYGFVYLVKSIPSKHTYALKLITLSNPDCAKVFEN